MNTSTIDIRVPDIQDVRVSNDTLHVELSDGRTISLPVVWYPRLKAASKAERDKWRLIGKGQGIHWEDLDEDISILSVLAGKPSAETQESFAKWLRKRAAAS